MSKLGDVRDQFPEAYCISKYNGTGTVSNQNHKWKHIKKSYGEMDWTKRSLIGGDTRRTETIGKCSTYNRTGGKHVGTIRQSGEGLIGCHSCDRCHMLQRQ